MKKLHKSQLKLPTIKEVSGWRNDKTTEKNFLHISVNSPFTVKSRKEMNLTPRYPRLEKLPPVWNPITTRVRKVEQTEEYLLESRLFEAKLIGSRSLERNLFSPSMVLLNSDLGKPHSRCPSRVHGEIIYEDNSEFAGYQGIDGQFCKYHQEDDRNIEVVGGNLLKVPENARQAKRNIEKNEKKQADSACLLLNANTQHKGKYLPYKSASCKGKKKFSCNQNTETISIHENLSDTYITDEDISNHLNIEKLNFDVIKYSKSRSYSVKSVKEYLKSSNSSFSSKSNADHAVHSKVFTKSTSMPIKELKTFTKKGVRKPSEYESTIIKVAPTESLSSFFKGEQSSEVSYEKFMKKYREEKQKRSEELEYIDGISEINKNVQSEFKRKHYVSKGVVGNHSISTQSLKEYLEATEKQRVCTIIDSKSEISEENLREEVKEIENFGESLIEKEKNLIEKGENHRRNNGKNKIPAKSGLDQIKNFKILSEDKKEEPTKTKVVKSSTRVWKAERLTRKSTQDNRKSKNFTKAEKSLKQIVRSKAIKQKNKKPKFSSQPFLNESSQNYSNSLGILIENGSSVNEENQSEQKEYIFEGQRLVINITKETSLQSAESVSPSNARNKEKIAQPAFTEISKTIQEVPFTKGLLSPQALLLGKNAFLSNSYSLKTEIKGKSEMFPNGLSNSKELEEPRRGTYNGYVPFYEQYKKKYAMEKDPVTCFISNFSRSLLFTINLISKNHSKGLSTLPKNIELAYSRQANRKTTKEADIFRNRRIQLENSIKEYNQEPVLTEKKEVETKEIVKSNLTSEVVKKVLEKSPITIMKEKLLELEKERKKEFEKQASNASKAKLEVFPSISNHYSKRTNYSQLEALTKARENEKIIKKAESSESSEEEIISSESSSERSSDDSDEDSSESSIITKSRRNSKVNYARYSAIYEVQHMELIQSLAKVIFDSKPRESIKVPLMEKFTSVNNDNSDIEEIINQLRTAEEKQTTSTEKADEINLYQLNLLQEKPLEKYLFFTNDQPFLSSRMNLNAKERRKPMISEESDSMIKRRILLKQKFLEGSKKKTLDFDEFTHLQIIPTEECISEKFPLKASIKLKLDPTPIRSPRLKFQKK